MAVKKTEALMSVLKDLQSSSADIEATAVVSLDGLVMASALPADLEEDRVAAMSAALLALGDRTAEELHRGQLEQVFVKGSGGYVILAHAGEEAVLVTMASANAKLGMIFLDVKRAAEDTEKLV